MLRWLFGRTPPEPLAAPTADQLAARLERVEDHYRRLERRFEKLQGEFSAYQRDRYEDDDYYEEEDDEPESASPRRVS